MAAEPTTLDAIITYLESTTDDQWQTDVVRSKDGKRNCFFGHLFNMGKDETESNQIWDWFESRWATTFVIYPVNDGTHPRYQQATPRERILAYLRNLHSGEEDDTITSMEKDFTERLPA